MAIFHFSAKVIGRSSGRSAVAAAAYRAGERLHDERIDRDHDFTNKAGVLHSEVMLPTGPQGFRQRHRPIECDCRACPHRGRAETPNLAVCGPRVGCWYPALVDPPRHRRPRRARKLALARTDGPQGRWRTHHRGGGHQVDPVAEPRSLGRTGGGAGHTECKPRGAGTVQGAGPQLKELNSLHGIVKALTCRCDTRRNGALSCATCERLQG